VISTTLLRFMISVHFQQLLLKTTTNQTYYRLPNCVRVTPTPALSKHAFPGTRVMTDNCPEMTSVLPIWPSARSSGHCSARGDPLSPPRYWEYSRRPGIVMAGCRIQLEPSTRAFAEEAFGSLALKDRCHVNQPERCTGRANYTTLSVGRLDCI